MLGSDAVGILASMSGHAPINGVKTLDISTSVKLPFNAQHEEEMAKLRQRIEMESKTLDDMEEDTCEAKVNHNLSISELQRIRSECTNHIVYLIV